VLRDPGSGERLDDALVLRFDGPASTTGEDVAELHCHGSRAVVDAVLGSLASLDDLREALPGEFTRRAFENGRIDLTEAEGLADLLEAETEAQRRAALRLAEGALRRQIETWRARLVDLSAQAERAIDYAEEDEEAHGSALDGACGDLADELEGWLDRPRIEPLRDGLGIVVAGPPNSGKSSLINSLSGDSMIIVSDIAGTTRDLINIPMAIAGLPVRLVDTAGIRETGDPVEAAGVELAQAAMRDADLILWLGDPEVAPDHPATIKVHAKADVAGLPPPGSVAVSAKTGEGIAALLELVRDRARMLLPAEDAVALNRRQAALISQAEAALRQAVDAEPVIQAEELRAARLAFDRITGAAGVEDMLDALFARFCLGK
jgi:tRNA modification GTPase